MMSPQPASEFTKRFQVPTIDPADEARKILDKVTPLLDDIEVFGNRVLVAKFLQAKKGSLIRAQRSVKEDEYQGKVGLVLKAGPLAFVNDTANNFMGQNVKPGDWVLFRYSDGNDHNITPPGTFDEIPAKVIADVDVQAVLARPDLFY